jgi:hypothetical protein
MRLLDHIKYSMCPLGYLIKKSDKLYTDYCAAEDFKEKRYLDVLKTNKELSEFDNKVKESDLCVTPEGSLDEEATREEIKTRVSISFSKYSFAQEKFFRIKDKCIAIRMAINRRKSTIK